MIPVCSSETSDLAQILKSYDLKDTLARVAGLLTAPYLQANALRLEILVHLVVAHASGEKKVDYVDLEKWLNKYLGQTVSAMLEDPVEDVFISNIETPEGNRRIFEGTWESNDYFLQVVLDILLSDHNQEKWQSLIYPTLALLRLSDFVAERLNLFRWHIEPSTDKGFISIGPSTRVKTRAQAISFTDKDLDGLEITRDILSPFIFSLKDRNNLLNESIGNTSLERHPLIDFGEILILCLPHAISPAIRYFILKKLSELGSLKTFEKFLYAYQAKQVEEEGLRELKDQTESLHPPPPDEGLTPSLHSWLLKYDINKYLHVILLHDRIDKVEEKGLSNLLNYPEPVRGGLDKYLNKVAKYCQTLPDYVEGMTLIVIGGIGRGFSLGFNELPENWLLSSIRIPDLLMLAGEIEDPVKRYLKCFKQKSYAEREGVEFININGDFNFYCYWRRLKYQLVPRELRVCTGSNIVVSNDFVLSLREELRNLNDRHVTKTAEGFYTRVMRFGRDHYFKSMQVRPIYASLDLLQVGILAGSVETMRGSTWLTIKPREGDEKVRHLLYEIWSGFIGLFDRLVNEIEFLIPHLSKEPIEIRLNFDEVLIYDEYKKAGTSAPNSEPTIDLWKNRNIAEIKFPPDFLVCFQNPENAGERFLLKIIARCLLGIQLGEMKEIESSSIENVLKKIINENTRILHLFPTYIPIEYLLAQKKQRFINFPQEDFVFAKLKLSDGCTVLKQDAFFRTKSECNKFLHMTVKKIWKELRTLLRQFDRTSVIRQTLAVNEAILQDRDQWRRTAQAVISLYNPVENVFMIAQSREHDRSQVALPARTILEMAICECPDSGGRILSQWDLDEILAKAALLLEVATDSDAINADLINPKIELHANGEYGINRDFHDTVIRPFLENYFKEEFEDAASNYYKLYQRERPNKQKKADKFYSNKFISAFTAEFGLSPDESIDGIAELLDLAVELDNVVIEITLGLLHKRLIERRGLSLSAYNCFLKTFGLFHRPAWDKPPSGFKNKDLNPWRFSRRLSSVVRPLLIFGEKENDKVLFGAGALRQSFGYIFDRIEQGQFPQTFFTSQEMKSYCGTVNHQRGHLFTKSVAETFHNKGWEVRIEVQMTELGAQSELGDIDVLAWKSHKEILIIECKRLQFARTVAEVAEICRRFRGEVNDDLDKHLRRFAWVKEHPLNLERIMGFSAVSSQIDIRLITNTHVPIKYLTSLPISVDKIFPFNRENMARLKQ